ncbi:MAG: hypothetical protein K5695_14275 [Oscillospiraceae bacterium]|nr:hypothetical protein [Oscillospiraceae bacterium]
MNRLLTIGLLDENGWKSLDATLQDTSYGVTDLEPCSVYAEVNRDNFKVGNVAVTNVAQGLQASTGVAPDEGVFGTNVSYLTAGVGVGSLAIGTAGIILAIKNWPKAAAPEALPEQLVQAVNDGGNLNIHGLTGNMLSPNSPVYKHFKAYDIMSQTDRVKMTLAGSNGNIRFDAGMLFDEEDGSFTLSDGTVYHKNGTQTVNQQLREN